MPPRPSTFSHLWPFHSTPRRPAGSWSEGSLRTLPASEDMDASGRAAGWTPDPDRGRGDGVPEEPRRRLPWTPIDWIDVSGWSTTPSLGQRRADWTFEPWTFQRSPHTEQPKRNFSW